jgi:MFS family permease
MAAVISDLAPQMRRGSWLGTYSAAQSAGNAAGQVLGGTLLSLGGFAYPFLAGGICGVVAFLLLPKVGGSAPSDIQVRVLTRLREALRAILSDRGILLVSLATAGQYIGNGALNGFLPLYAREVAGLEAWEVGVLFGAQTGCVLAFRPILGTLSDRWGRPPLMMAGMLASAALLFVLPMLRSFASLIVLTSLYGAAFAATSAASMAWITDLASRRNFGTAHGAYGTIFDAGDAAGPIAAGLLISSLGYTLGFRILVIPPAIFIALLAANATPRRDHSSGV